MVTFPMRRRVSSEGVPKIWSPQVPVVCIGGGPSLTAEDVMSLAALPVHIIAVNDAYKLTPFAAVLFAADFWWWKKENGAPSFHGMRFSLEERASKYGCRILRPGPEDGLSDDPMVLNTGENSGYSAINLAVLLGAKTIFLLGYDMKSGADGRTHWFGNHDNGYGEPPYARHLSHFPSLVAPLAQRGVSVINCTRDTALLTFPRVPLEDVIKEIANG